jgi:hypothetical protein
MRYSGHQHITRTLLTAFMDFLNDIKIEKYRWDTTLNAFVPRKQYKVPVMYTSHEKFLQIYKSSSARKTMPPEASNAPVEIQWILPRISVHLMGIAFDNERHYNKTNVLSEYASPNHASFLYAPVPYNLDIEVSHISKSMDDAFQIMEQILPYFTPSMSIDVRLFPSTPAESITIVLNSTSFDFPQEVAEADERLYSIIYQFSLRANYYNQSSLAKIITDVLMNQGTEAPADYKFNQYVANAIEPSLFPTPSGTTSDLERMTLNKRGDYNPLVVYSTYDLVDYGNHKYVYINKDSTKGNDPRDSEGFWVLLTTIRDLDINVEIM